MALHSSYCANVPLRNCSLTHPQFSVKRHILSRAAEFARFRGISAFSRNSLLADEGDKYGIFWSGLGGRRN